MPFNVAILVKRYTSFVERILAGERLSPRSAAHHVTLDSLASGVADLYDIAVENLRSKIRRSLIVEARSLFCFRAVRHGGFSAATVATFLNMTPPGVGYAVERGEKIAREKGHGL